MRQAKKKRTKRQNCVRAQWNVATAAAAIAEKRKNTIYLFDMDRAQQNANDSKFFFLRARLARAHSELKNHSQPKCCTYRSVMLCADCEHRTNVPDDAPQHRSPGPYFVALLNREQTNRITRVYNTQSARCPSAAYNETKIFRNSVFERLFSLLLFNLYTWNWCYYSAFRVSPFIGHRVNCHGEQESNLNVRC